MQPTYNHCSGISGIDDSSYFTLIHFLIADIFSLGPGSHAVRQKLIMAKLAGAQNVFQDVLERSEGDFMSFHEEWARRAADQLQAADGSLLEPLQPRNNTRQSVW